MAHKRKMTEVSANPVRKEETGHLHISGKKAQALMQTNKPGNKFRAVIEGKIENMSMNQYGDEDPSHSVGICIENVKQLGGMSKSKTLRKGI